MKEDFKQCKYVVLGTLDGELPVLIPKAMPHDYFKPLRIISAGFFDLETLTTYGESTGLGLKPRPEDADLIKVFFNLEKT